jgi:probable rRNA maturation factor
VGLCGKILTTSQKNLFKKSLTSAIKLAKIADRGPVEISLATKEQISQIKKDFWGKNRPTDVVSFRYNEADGNGISAEIIICPEIALERAEEYGNTFIFELLLYAVHGILHIAGENDSTQAEKNKMRKEENKIMEILQAKFSGLRKKRAGKT